MLMMNLLPWRQRLAYRRLRLAAVVSAGALLVGLVIGMVLRGDAHQQRLRLQQQLAQTQAQQVRYERLYREVHRDWLMYEKQQALQAARLYGRRQAQRYQQLLEQLPARMPATLWLTDIDGAGRQLHLSGISHRYDDIMQWVNRLSQWPLIERVVLEQARLEKTQPDEMHFSLRLYWQVSGAPQERQ
ncbi:MULTISPECIES: PilN domain-containing protein [Dickeya]|uniref:Type IV pilus biogenesis protein PilN n=1 Tax=Dickeya aquatica TaxID=1401087 RepID=A0A375AG58_9GAMM|nr:MULTISPECIES: PilN domain-containing protein [Dickeya]SLM64896.1 hypothetical protein DAQ1742_04131 [Dickeya aquatica]